MSRARTEHRQHGVHFSSPLAVDASVRTAADGQAVRVPVRGFAKADGRARADYKRHGRSCAADVIGAQVSGGFEPLLEDEIPHLLAGDMLVLVRKRKEMYTGVWAIKEDRWEHAVVGGWQSARSTQRVARVRCASPWVATAARVVPAGARGRRHQPNGGAALRQQR